MLSSGKNNKGKLSPGQEALAVKIASGIVNFQRRIAMYLNTKTAHFSKVQKTILLLGISIAFSGISLYLILKSII